jgi:hypothetical protein
MAGRREKRGKPASEVPHPKAELRWWLAATEEWQGSDGDGDRGAAAKAVQARALRQGGGGCRICGA